MFNLISFIFSLFSANIAQAPDYPLKCTPFSVKIELGDLYTTNYNQASVLNNNSFNVVFLTSNKSCEKYQSVKQKDSKMILHESWAFDSSSSTPFVEIFKFTSNPNFTSNQYTITSKNFT
jgi:hypothetical protein